MASIGNDDNGRKRILFVAGDGSRKTIRLGKATAKQAESFKLKVEAIISASITGNMDAETSRWIAERDDTIHARLAAVGLIPGRASMTLQAFVDQFIAERTDAKPATLIVFGHTRRCLIEFFGANHPLRSITAGDADRWRASLIGQGLAEATIGRRCGIAKQIFRAALRRKLIDANPFADLKARVRGNKGREYFLPREDAQKILDACPNAEWRLLFALSRFGGLRNPSETLGLKWTDVDFDRGRLLVHSPKTEHHEGKGERWIPIFPELRQPLLDVFEQAEPGTEYVITRYRGAGVNLRTQFERIIKRAGLSRGPNCSITCEQRGKPSLRRNTRSTLFVHGSATAGQSHKRTISWLRICTSNRRHAKRHSTRRNRAVRGRKWSGRLTKKARIYRTIPNVTA